MSGFSFGGLEPHLELRSKVDLVRSGRIFGGGEVDLNLLKVGVGVTWSDLELRRGRSAEERQGGTIVEVRYC